MINIYVGNLPFRTTEQELADLFGQHGQVDKVSIILDKQTGRSRGFGFVEMNNDEEGRRAVEAFNGFEMEGRNLTVNEARPREQSAGGYGGNRSGGFGGGNRGYSHGGGYKNRNRAITSE